MPDMISSIPEPCQTDEPVLQAIIFDLDGTLLDTLADLAEAGNAVLTAHGKTAAPIEAYKHYVGAGARNLMIRAFADAGLQLDPSDPWLDQLAGEFSQAYDACWSVQTRAYDGIPTMLADLSARGLKMMVLSNKPDDFTQKIVGHYFPDIDFTAVCGKQAGWPLKPDPALALDLCCRIGVEPGQTAFVGDSGSDMETARRGQMLPIGVLWGFRSADELRQNHAAQLFHEPPGLAEWLVAHVDKDLTGCSPDPEQKGGAHGKTID